MITRQGQRSIELLDLETGSQKEKSDCSSKYNSYTSKLILRRSDSRNRCEFQILGGHSGFYIVCSMHPSS